MPYLSCKKIENDVYNFPTWQYCKYKDIFDSRIIINSTAKFYISISYQKDLLSIDTRIFTPSKFKTNLLAILGFLFSVILANIVSDQPLDNIFTKDITILSEIVLIASFGYLFISYQQSKYELQKVYSSYDKLKDSYREILTEDDIRECFQNDDIKTEMKRTIDRSVRIYLIIWGGILLSLLILVEYMSSEPFIWPILKSLFQITKK